MAARLVSILGTAATAGATLPTVQLKNGVLMPLLAEGTWQYNDTEAEAAVIAAVKTGFTAVDTAWQYKNQAGVGRALRAEGVDRKSVFVETKVPGCGMDPAVSRATCYEDTKKVLEEDLRLLNQSYVDLMLLHFPPLGTVIMRTCHFSCGEIREQWAAMEEFYKAGKARAIGVSNYCPSCFECLEGNATVYPMVNQVGYHLGMGADPSGFRSFADKKGVVLQAYSPLGNDWDKFFGKHADHELLTGKFTTGLAATHNVSTIQVALKWLVEHGVPTVTKSSNPKHLASDLDLWSWNLTQAEMTAADKFRMFGIPSFACNFETGIVV